MRLLRTIVAILFVTSVGLSEVIVQTPTDLSALSWLAGSWSGVQKGVEMEEMWLPAKGNTMLGLHRDVKDGRTVMFEFLRIEAAANGITYWASPRGQPATPFRLAEINQNHAVFENREHDFPQRIIYRLTKDGKLYARVEGTLKGKPAFEEWTWSRSQPR
ncbi:MAG: DUF6265 family protein [Pyrinomonadaceae bacterium]